MSSTALVRVTGHPIISQGPRALLLKLLPAITAKRLELTIRSEISRAVTRLFNESVSVYGSVLQLPYAYEDGDERAWVVFEEQVIARLATFREYLTVRHDLDPAECTFYADTLYNAFYHRWTLEREIRAAQKRRERAAVLANEIL